MANIKIWAIVLLLLLGAAAFFAWPSLFPIDEGFKNGTYLIEGTPVTLADGYAETIDSAAGFKTVTKYFGRENFGDLNNDGRKDSAFVITQTTSGSGTFYYVVAALRQDNGYQGTNAVFLGDRISPQSLSIDQNRITAVFLDRGEDEPMAAEPTIPATKYLEVKGHNLEIVAE